MITKCSLFLIMQIFIHTVSCGNCIIQNFVGKESNIDSGFITLDKNYYDSCNYCVFASKNFVMTSKSYVELEVLAADDYEVLLEVYEKGQGSVLVDSVSTKDIEPKGNLNKKLRLENVLLSNEYANTSCIKIVVNKNNKSGKSPQIKRLKYVSDNNKICQENYREAKYGKTFFDMQNCLIKAYLRSYSQNIHDNLVVLRVLSGNGFIYNFKDGGNIFQISSTNDAFVTDETMNIRDAIELKSKGLLLYQTGKIILDIDYSSVIVHMTVSGSFCNPETFNQTYNHQDDRIDPKVKTSIDFKLDLGNEAYYVAEVKLFIKNIGKTVVKFRSLKYEPTE